MNVNLQSLELLGTDYSQKLQVAPRASRTLGSRTYHDSNAAQTVNDISHMEAPIEIDSRIQNLSSVFLRDLCECLGCVHVSSKQKLYSTIDIPSDIGVKSISDGHAGETFDLGWSKDVPGFDVDHMTTIKKDALRELIPSGAAVTPFSSEPSKSIPWDSRSAFPDFDHEEYMEDDTTLLKAIEQLQTYGLVFITNVPGVESSVSDIAERIRPIKDTFYGRT